MDILQRNYNDKGVEQICEFLNERLGFTYGVQKKYLIHTRLEKRLDELNLNSYQAYLALIKRDLNELNHFFDLLTTNVTSFFREDEQFLILKNALLPILINRSNGPNKLRCWSAGCSSGEEAYTLAIVLMEALGSAWDIKVLASDVSIRKLQEGMVGVYSAERLKEVPVNLREKYFIPVQAEKRLVRVIPELRARVVFRKINLNQGFEIPPNIKFDLVMCRNVFIYLGKESRERVLNGFYSYLKEGGYLFVGNSEPINTYSDPRWLVMKNCIYQKK